MLFCFGKLERNKPASEGRSLALSTSLSPVQKVQQLQLLNGKLRSSLRRLYSLQREKAKLQHRVRKCDKYILSMIQWFFSPKFHFISKDFYFRFNSIDFIIIWYDTSRCIISYFLCLHHNKQAIRSKNVDVLHVIWYYKYM